MKTIKQNPSWAAHWLYIHTICALRGKLKMSKKNRGFYLMEVVMVPAIGSDMVEGNLGRKDGGINHIFAQYVVPQDCGSLFIFHNIK
ncbi:MAG: hypothetical protein RIG62_22800 [Cyclobacteriaceae bacterium]|jgi:hypothetical protein